MAATTQMRAPSAARAGPARVLVVHPDPARILWAKGVLEGLGATVLGAASADRAGSMLRSVRLDLVLVATRGLDAVPLLQQAAAARVPHAAAWGEPTPGWPSVPEDAAPQRFLRFAADLVGNPVPAS